jgi:hypothetical protein
MDAIRDEAKAKHKKAKAPNGEDAAGQKPRLLIENCNPDQRGRVGDTLRRQAALTTAVRSAWFDRRSGIIAQVMTPDAVVLAAHTSSRPYVIKSKSDGTISKSMPGCRAVRGRVSRLAW